MSVKTANDAGVFVALDLDRTLFETVMYAKQIAEGTGAPIDPVALRMNGADTLLSELRRRGIAFGIITYGPVEAQTTKLHAAGYTAIPYIVTDTPQKSRLIQTWRQTDGRYLIPAELAGGAPLKVSRIILVDDKAVAFEGLPSGVDGFLFRRDGVPVLEQQMGDVPASVRILRHLEDVISAAGL